MKIALVQRAKFYGGQPMFEEVADRILSMAISEGSMSTIIDIVFDTYPRLSIKYNERVHRGIIEGLQIKNVAYLRQSSNGVNFWHKKATKSAKSNFWSWNGDVRYLEKLDSLHNFFSHL
jgi:hypothetical protein